MRQEFVLPCQGARPLTKVGIEEETSRGVRRRLYQDATRAALLGLGINLTLGMVKLLAGYWGGSFALLSDAVNSMGDAVTSAVVVFALWIAQWPPDAQHPYGHTRAEAIAGSNVALALIASAFLLAWEAWGRWGLAHDQPATWTVWIALANVVIKEALYHYKIRVGRRTGSLALIANAWDHRADALCSLVVLVGLLAGKWTGWASADELAALVVVAAILWSAVLLFSKSVHELMDVQADAEFVDAVRAAAASVNQVARVEKLWVRKTGLEYLVDIHVQVDPRMTVEVGHRVGHSVKDYLLRAFPRVRDVLVHLEPLQESDAVLLPM